MITIKTTENKRSLVIAEDINFVCETSRNDYNTQRVTDCIKVVFKDGSRIYSYETFEDIERKIQEALK